MKLDPKYRAKINPKYAEFFPDVEPDEVWNNYFDQKAEEIYAKINSEDLQVVLDGYIDALNSCTEYYSKQRGSYDHNPIVLFTQYPKFLKLMKLQYDIKYLCALQKLDETSLKGQTKDYLLQKLTEIKENRYIPLDEFTKKQIQKTFRAFVLKTWGRLDFFYYKDFFDD